MKADSFRQFGSEALNPCFTAHNGNQISWIEIAPFKKRLYKRLSHAAQANHPNRSLHNAGISALQRAAAPQAGEGAETDSDSEESDSLVTTVGLEASSWVALVTVTQLGANRKILSPTRS